MVPEATTTSSEQQAQSSGKHSANCGSMETKSGSSGEEYRIVNERKINCDSSYEMIFADRPATPAKHAALASRLAQSQRLHSPKVPHSERMSRAALNKSEAVRQISTRAQRASARVDHVKAKKSELDSAFKCESQRAFDAKLNSAEAKRAAVLTERVERAAICSSKRPASEQLKTPNKDACDPTVASPKSPVVSVDDKENSSM